MNMTMHPRTRRVRRGPIFQVCGYLRRKNFTSARNRLLQVSGFKEALIKVCGKIISSEVRHVKAPQTELLLTLTNQEELHVPKH